MSRASCKISRYGWDQGLTYGMYRTQSHQNQAQMYLDCQMPSGESVFATLIFHLLFWGFLLSLNFLLVGSLLFIQLLDAFKMFASLILLFGLFLVEGEVQTK